MILYLVGTPIGNLEDWSPRALATLQAVSVLALEKWTDTAKLLHHFGLRPEVIVNYDDRRQKTATAKILTWLETRDVALVTSAGLPGISDPGAYLVAAARVAGHQVVPVPGPSALSTALAVSGWTESVWFVGFLPRTRGKIVKLWAQAEALGSNLLCFESTHRLAKTLALLAEKHPTVEVFVGKEMTKKFEDYSVGLAADFLARLAVDKDYSRGEFTLIIHFGK
ncbi:MAG: rRNA (cytidine-2'-O-)-methyltransferase [Candidatus Vogelbacteria bacterium CG10_big_fil_rev_8_21_14_0_10_49_38]|uniref:rRNA (Cytidine-2'-O-)-methyltransferase n=1 Tax=Candidatus Vogelbacteria bacterium CG10_big_fil_rev_8_21_14_0_10_49_38 TaxID=1975043 RepID=A0A2H0RJS0_9BACT|nr:MAG: hypothetical protein BK006_02015 [bacterium CG10_49_38]PIR46025.1 MAG: rRNA (cytidine-2'-O-)-methyltransferase [Candidatus Vogelbacteria bacterium CG10_big_fil_rev_8_21_14_0_10_49_38]